MKKYTIELDETIADFFEEIAIIANRPAEAVMSDGLFKQVEIIKRHVANFSDADEE